MEEILDEGLSNDKSELKKAERLRLLLKIKEIEKKNWYGMVLICIIIGLILVSLLVKSVAFEFSMPFVIINVFLIIIHAILLYLSKSDKLMAYVGGLITFLVTIFLNVLMARVLYLGAVFWIIVIVGSYLIFIYEEIKLKRLKSKLNENRF